MGRHVCWFAPSSSRLIRQATTTAPMVPARHHNKRVNHINSYHHRSTNLRRSRWKEGPSGSSRRTYRSRTARFAKLLAHGQLTFYLGRVRICLPASFCAHHIATIEVSPMSETAMGLSSCSRCVTSFNQQRVLFQSLFWEL
jgi:hypothetical protein